jgi:hypothetical protein
LKLSENEAQENPLANVVVYSELSKSTLIELLRVRDQQIAAYERALLSFTPTPANPKSDDLEPVQEKELVMNKINRTNIRTIGAVLSNRSRDKDRFKYRPLNKAK